MKVTVILVAFKESTDAYIRETPQLSKEDADAIREPRTFEYEADGRPGDILDAAFERFNIGEDEIARRYRAAGNRSLSVGDVVVVGENAWRVAPVGFTMMTADQTKRLLAAIAERKGGT